MSLHAKVLSRREEAFLVTGLAIAAVTGWAYLLAGAGMDMAAMRQAGGTAAVWTPQRLATVLVMWVVMMAAMMLPSAAPVLLLHRTVDRKRAPGPLGVARTGLFAAGYLLVWTGFGAGATAIQWGLDERGLLAPSMTFDTTPVSATVLLAAGLFQLSPLKQACLRHCRSPLAFLAQNWRDGAAGLLAMGARHGLYCLGCCWALMALLFVGGVMNMLWIAGLTVWVLVEKLAPRGRALSRAAGIALVAAAVAMLVAWM